MGRAHYNAAPSVENAALARLLFEIADLLEIRGDNPFKIRAYRSAGELVIADPRRVADLDDGALRELPGIGKDLAQRIREFVTTGDSPFRQEVAASFPPTLLELLRLQGVGPKTVKRLYEELGVASLDALEAAARSGRVRAMKGMGGRKEALILKAIEERRRYAGRHLAASVHQTARTIVERLVAVEPGAEVVPVGSLRRGVEICGDLDLLAVGASPALMTAFAAQPEVVRVLGVGDTKASVLLTSGLQADLRLVEPAARGAALQYFTGSKAHNIALRDRALSRGMRLNEYGLFQSEGTRVAGDTEESIYEALGLAFVPPELREHRGEIERAEARSLPRLVARTDLRGDLHVHTTATDGKDDIETMALAARAAGLEYIAITDHSQALAMAGGLDERRALAHAATIRAIGRRLDGITLLAGIECDIRLDGTLDLADECLAALDLVVASVHSGFSQEPRALTERYLRALECPWVDVLGHPTGRLLLKREPLRFDLEAVLDAAVRHGVAIEINCQVDRLDVSDAVARHALDKGARLIISSDAHSAAAFGVLDGGIRVARRAWASPTDILNTRTMVELHGELRRHRSTRLAS
jgi:DNA polymerase (family 10)